MKAKRFPLQNLIKIFISALFFLLASAMGYILHSAGFPDTNVVVIYLLSVLIIVWLTNSFTIGIFVSVAETFTFNYFFTEPRYTFEVNDPNYYVTFITMTFTALVASSLTTRARQEAYTARQREAETKAIYMLTNKLSDAQTLDDIINISLNAICEGLRCNAGCLCFNEKGEPERTFIYHCYGDNNRQVRRETEHPDKLKYRISHLREDHDEGTDFFDWPLYGSRNILGIIRLDSDYAATLSKSQMRVLHSMTESIALAMDRFLTSQQRMKSIEEAAHERYRATLLRSISHDIRTPLTGIIGTSEMLEDALKGDEYNRGLAESIRKDAQWLHSMVENILSMTRLQDGAVKLKKEFLPVEEVIGGAISKIEHQYPGYDIEVDIPDELIMLPMDPKLIQQAIINLIGNAVKHSKPTEPISIHVEKDEKDAIFTITDSGEGIATKDLPYIFQSFYSVENHNVTKNRGFGLGLAICEAIINAHDGTISAANRTDGHGAVFTFTLPLEEKDEQ